MPKRRMVRLFRGSLTSLHGFRTVYLFHSFMVGSLT